MSTYYRFRILGAPPAFDVPFLAIVRRRFIVPVQAQTVYLNLQTMSEIRNMVRALHLRGETVQIQFDEGPIQTPEFFLRMA